MSAASASGRPASVLTLFLPQLPRSYEIALWANSSVQYVDEFLRNSWGQCYFRERKRELERKRIMALCKFTKMAAISSHIYFHFFTFLTVSFVLIFSANRCHKVLLHVDCWRCVLSRNVSVINGSSPVLMMMMMMTGFHQGVSDVLDFIKQYFELTLDLVQQTSAVVVFRWRVKTWTVKTWTVKNVFFSK